MVTRENSDRVARFTFDYAKRHDRKKVTTVHKANIMKSSDGLFLAVMREVAKDYPDIKHDDMIIDNCCMQLVSNPHQFDVMVMPNLYGTIVSNVICGLIGGAGLLSGRNYGHEVISKLFLFGHAYYGIKDMKSKGTYSFFNFYSLRFSSLERETRALRSLERTLRIPYP